MYIECTLTAKARVHRYTSYAACRRSASIIYLPGHAAGPRGRCSNIRLPALQGRHDELPNVPEHCKSGHLGVEAADNRLQAAQHGRQHQREHHREGQRHVAAGEGNAHRLSQVRAFPAGHTAHHSLARMHESTYVTPSWAFVRT